MNDIPRYYASYQPPVNFRFFQSAERFHVEELPLRQPTGGGEWLWIKFRKRDLSTWRLLNILKSATGASDREIGYAGLKDKSATSIQYITLPRRYEKGLGNLQTERIEVLELYRTRHPLKLGQLRGNRFKILLDRIDPADTDRIFSYVAELARKGIPNYFGYQRFGDDGRAWEQGREIARSGKRLKGSKERLLVAAWQSRLFNTWLGERIRIGRIVDTHEPSDAARLLDWPEELTGHLAQQKHLFKLFHGDLLHPSFDRRLYYCVNPAEESEKLLRRRCVPTGLLPGSKILRARNDARHLELPYDDSELDSLPGERRDAWIWPSEMRAQTDGERGVVWLEFTLPAGSYATVLLEELSQRPFGRDGESIEERKKFRRRVRRS